jgi:NADH dehydrogenase [ubiquinone] 1 alpha subcomplex assembly factor 7
VSEDAPLRASLARLIRAGGPITIARYMAEALGHPTHGYYRRADPLGAAGDFITAPEISQMFGELLGLWAVACWHQIGAPAPVRLVELGPGRGTLMADALRAARAAAPAFCDAAAIHLVETSPVLRARQAERLASERLAAEKITWHDRLDSVPDGPMILLANEFFDALPIHQFVRRADGWHERLVDLRGEALVPVLSAAPSPAAAALPDAIRNAPIGAVGETCPTGLAIVRGIAARLTAHGGAALIIDYGSAKSAPGDSLQAVRRHRYVDVFAEPGLADLTAHVDFAALAGTAREAGAQAHGPRPQGHFLGALGLDERARRLRANATPAQARDIEAAVRRLVDEREMGVLFKALALTGPNQSPPAGFEP